MQSAFSLKIRLVLDLIQRDCKPRCYYIGVETRREKTVSFFFFSGLRPRFSRQEASPLACLGFAFSDFAKKNKRLLAVYIRIHITNFMLSCANLNKGHGDSMTLSNRKSLSLSPSVSIAIKRSLNCVSSLAQFIDLPGRWCSSQRMLVLHLCNRLSLFKNASICKSLRAEFVML